MSHLPPTSRTSSATLAGPALWRRWLLLVSIGELVGFSAPAALALWTRGLSSNSQLPVLVVGGMIEGAALGLAQASVLRRVLPGFRATAWVVATSAAAGVAWLLGMLPAVAHAVWSTWTRGGVLVAAAVLGAALLMSIGTAQALVMPAGTPKAFMWIWWTALGWCGGLAAFSAVAPPLWHEGQAPLLSALIGVAGGAVMAVVMAAVTGVGMLRLCARAGEARWGPAVEGSKMLSALVGSRVRHMDGREVGRLRDLEIDLAGGLDRVPVTGVVVGSRGQGDRLVPWERVHELGWGGALVRSESTPVAAGRKAATVPTRVWVRRDILDSPVVLADPPRRARVSDVVLELEQGHAWVTGIDLSTVGAWRRLLGRPVTTAQVEQVPLSQVHLVGSPAHSAQLAVAEAMVFGLQPQGMAEVLTRVPVSRARDILGVADERVAGRALSLLHPHVRARLTVAGPAPRRTRRLAGWLLHRPGHAVDGDQSAPPGDSMGSGPQAEP